MWALRSCQYFRFKAPILWIQNFSISLPKYLLPAENHFSPETLLTTDQGSKTKGIPG